jgi:hypothetical protein
VGRIAVDDTQASVCRVRSNVQRWGSPERLGAIGLASFWWRNGTLHRPPGARIGSLRQRSVSIRALIVPAVMALAGRWNWYPGRRRPET